MNFLYDFKFALRSMLQKPSFAAMTIAIMTIGLGMCIYNYSFIYGLMFKPLPFNNGERMYVINVVANGMEYNGGSVLPADYLLMREELEGIEKIGAYHYDSVRMSQGDRTVREVAVRTQANMFDYTQVLPLKGRVLNAEDNQVGAAKVAVIGYAMWQSQFGERPDILGHTMLINGEVTEIVGVMPDGYRFPGSMNLWLPIQRDLASIERRDYLGLEVFIQLEPGYSVSQVNAQLVTLMARLEQQYPETNTGYSAMAKNYLISQVGNGGMGITYSMAIAVIFIMTLASVNVANLLFARATERAKETAIRVALGAPRGRLIMQMLWESLLICSVGGVLAILLSGWGMQVTKGIMAEMFNGPMPYFWQFELDAHIVQVAVIIVILTSLVTGLLPALKISGGDFNQVLRDGTRGAQSRGASKISTAIVILEITLSCALLTTAGVLAAGIKMTDNTDYGVNTDNKLLARIALPESKYPEASDRVPFYLDVIRELEAQPEIARASIAGNMPGSYAWYTRIAIDGKDNSDMARLPQSNVTNMFPGMFDILGIKAIAGRLYDDGDRALSPIKVVVTDSFVEQNFDSMEAALGKQFTLAQTEQESALFEIVGVIPHVIFGQPYSNFKYRPSIITNSLQDSLSELGLVLEPAGDVPALSLQNTLSRVMYQLDKDIPPYNFHEYDAVLKGNTAGMNFLSDVFNLFALAAIILAATGIYGVMANTIKRRTQEFGVRRALGAPDGHIVKMLLKKGLWQFAIGAAIGAPLAYLIGDRLVALMDAGNQWLNVIYVLMPLLIGAVVMLSTYLPTLKAVRLEPGSALRYE